MRSALAEVSKHAESQKFKRENPDLAYKHVKSKLAGNMKSIEKAKKRDKQKKEAEQEGNSSPTLSAVKFLFERKLSNASPLKSPASPSKSPSRSPLQAKMQSAAAERIRLI